MACQIGEPARRTHGMGVQEVQAARDVQGDLVALAVPDELRALVLVQRVPQIATRHILAHGCRFQPLEFMLYKGSGSSKTAQRRH